MPEDCLAIVWWVPENSDWMTEVFQIFSDIIVYENKIAQNYVEANRQQTEDNKISSLQSWRAAPI